MQFFLQTVLHNLRQCLPVQLMRSVIADFRKLPVAILNDRRAFIRAHRRHRLYHIRNQIRVGNHHFLRLIASQISKFLQHLLRRSQIERRLIIRIGKALSCHDNTTVYFIFRI